MSRLALSFIGLTLTFFTYAFGAPPDEGPCKTSEVAMKTGMVISAMFPNAKIRITAVTPEKRKFEWGKACSQTNTLIARDTRWYGSCGLYDPAYSEDSTKNQCEGTSRIVAEDMIRDFKSAEEAHSFATSPEYGMTTLYRNDGWVIRYGVFPQRYQINVTVARVLINGKAPTTLPGAQDSKISVK